MPNLMPIPIVPPPGVVLTEGDRVVEGRFIAADKIRFVKGRAQKIGGWVLAAATPTVGQPRAMHAWRDLGGNQYLAVGTYKKLYVYDTSLIQNDITPYRATGTYPNNPLSTTISTPNVSVHHVGHGVSAGDTIYIAGATAIGGITPNGTFTVFTVTDADNFVYVFTSNATSTVSGGGGAAVTYKYEVPVGTELGTTGLGWGVGGWGLLTWGTARANSTIVFEPRVWSLDHFGKILLASYNGGSIYTFDPSLSQPWGRAAVIATAPTDCRFMFVTPERFVFALREGMVVSWCSQGDYTDWTPTTSNTANSRTLAEGNKLVSGKVLAPNVSLVWTDTAVYLFQYTGSQFIYNSPMIAKNCGLIGPNAAVTVNGVAYWMGHNNFLMFNGTVQPMPNAEDVRASVFSELTTQYGYQCAAVYNPKFNEIWFLYTRTGMSSPDRAVIYSIENQCWVPGGFTRVGGTNFPQGDTRPFFGDSTGYLYQHENGYDDAGVAMSVSLTLSPYAMNEGKTSLDVQAILFDFFQQSGQITATVNTYDRLTDTAVMDSETDVIADVDTGLTDTRVSGRYIGLSLTSSVLGGYFRWGKPIAWVMPSGQRS